uniref:Uncharacterized protein n=1 Tax=Cacopsylla melanoneura TaxID=428564 RepID=A0A8D9F8P0_9HEMI
MIHPIMLRQGRILQRMTLEVNIFLVCRKVEILKYYIWALAVFSIRYHHKPTMFSYSSYLERWDHRGFLFERRERAEATLYFFNYHCKVSMLNNVKILHWRTT